MAVSTDLSVQTSSSFCAIVICCNFTAEAGIALRDMSANASTSGQVDYLQLTGVQLALVKVRLQRHVDDLERTAPLDCNASCAYGTSVFVEAS